MADSSFRGHYHPGRSTHDLLDPERVLKATGPREGDSFLDAGCGYGYLSLAASEIVGDGGKVYAIDIYEPAISALRRESSERGATNIEAIAADVTGMTPLASDSIDVSLMANVLHGFVENAEDKSVMREITRVLKRGATLAVVEFKKLENAPGPPFSIKLAPEQVTAIVTPYGYRQEKVIEVGQYHYAIIFRKA